MDLINLPEFITSQINTQIISFIGKLEDCSLISSDVIFNDSKILINLKVQKFNQFEPEKKVTRSIQGRIQRGRKVHISVSNGLIKHLVTYKFIDFKFYSVNREISTELDIIIEGYVELTDRIFIKNSPDSIFKLIPLDLLKLLILRLNRLEIIFF